MFVALMTLLRVPTEKQSALEAEFDKEGGDESVLTPFTNQLKILSPEELTKLQDNFFTQKLETVDFNKESLPDAFYRKVKGAVLSSKEKALAEEHGITGYTSFNDLFSKITEKLTQGKGKTGDEETKKLIEDLRAQIKKVEKEKEDAVAAVKNEFHTQAIQNEYSTSLSGIGLEYDKDALPIQQEMLSALWEKRYKTERKDGKTIVIDKATGKVVVNELLEPQPISVVLESLAKTSQMKFKEPDPGGRGGNGSDPKNKTVLTGKSFFEACKEKNISPTSAEGDAFRKEYDAANQTSK